MKPLLSFALVFAIAAINAPAQTFEVVSIKPTTKSFLQAVTDGSLIGFKITSERVSIGQTDLNALIRRAYNVGRDQIVGPPWLQDLPDFNKAGVTFDIEAKLPVGATPDQLPVMLQALLADRFQLKVHKASTQTQSYALIVGPKGPKFQRKTAGTDPAAPLPAGPEFSVVTKGGAVTATSNGTTRTILAGGGVRIETSTIAGLAKSLMLDLPVVDKTNLTGDFNIVFEIHSGTTAAGQTMDEIREAYTEAVMAGVEALGLKLVRQKNSIETIVIDSVNRNPTEN